MSNKNITLIWNSGFLLIALCLLLLGSLLDLETSQQMYYGDSFFPLVGDVLGKMPGYLALSISFSLLFTAGRRRGFRGLDLLLNIMYFVGIVVSFTLMFHDCVELLLAKESKVWQVLLSFMIGVAFAAFSIKLYKRVDEETLLKLKKWSIATIISIAIVIVLVIILKYSWGRPRFIDVDNGSAKFSEWWQAAPSRGGDSFPSGHVALACCSFFFVPFIDIIYEGNFKGIIIVDACATAYTLLTAFFRIMGGHHFMSDVAVSMILVVLVHYISMRVSYGKNFSSFYFKETNFLNRL